MLGTGAMLALSSLVAVEYHDKLLPIALNALATSPSQYSTVLTVGIGVEQPLTAIVIVIGSLSHVSLVFVTVNVNIFSFSVLIVVWYVVPVATKLDDSSYHFKVPLPLAVNKGAASPNSNVYVVFATIGSDFSVTAIVVVASFEH